METKYQKLKDKINLEVNQTIREFVPYEICQRLEEKGKLAPVSIEDVKDKHLGGIVGGLLLTLGGGGFVPADLITKFEVFYGIPTLAVVVGMYAMADSGERYENPLRRNDATWLAEKSYELYKNIKEKLK